jgi:signal transduction histidine kinase
MESLKASDPRRLWRRYALSVAALVALAVGGLVSIERGMADAARQGAMIERVDTLAARARHIAENAHWVVYGRKADLDLNSVLLDQIDAFEESFAVVAACEGCAADAAARHAALFGGPSPTLVEDVARFILEARRVADGGVVAVAAERRIDLLFDARLADRLSTLRVRFETLALESAGERLWTARLTFAGILLVVASQGALIFLRGHRAISEAIRWRDVMLARLETTGEQLRGALAVSERAREEVDRARRAEASAHAIKSEFLARLSHEVRTPLNGILGAAALMAARARAAEDAAWIETIRRAGRAIESAFDDMIELARLGAGDIRLDPAPFDARALALARVDRVRHAAEAAGASLTLSVAPEAEGRYLADGARIGRVMEALLDNAVKYAPGGAIRLALTRWEDHGLRIEVSDSGPGVPEPMREAIFERFTQAEGSERRRVGGLGIGLALARETIHAMGGEMGVSAAEEGGARFWFEAPALPMGAFAAGERTVA